MIVYHGSTEEVRHPLVGAGRANLDFGRGFYVTGLREQAVSWASRPVNAGRRKCLNVYDFDTGKLAGLHGRVLVFDSYDRQWLDFVVGNRNGGESWKGYDVIVGGVANDRVFNTVELYAAHLITAGEALQRLRYHKPNNQICITSQGGVDGCLAFLRSETL